MLYEECKTPYEYIRRRVITNLGSQSIATKEELLRMCKMLGIEGVDKSSLKETLVDALIKDLGIKGFAEAFYPKGLGISSYEIQHKFNISGDEVKRMDRLGFIHCVGLTKFRKYGRTLKAPLYDIFEFYTLTLEKVDWFLKVNPKGTRKTQVRYDYIIR